MSKVKVDVLEDTSGNQMIFPSSALSDGYLTVDSSGNIGSQSISETTEVIKLFDEAVDGALSNANVVCDISNYLDDLKNRPFKILVKGVEGITGFRPTDGDGNTTITQNAYYLSRYYSNDNGSNRSNTNVNYIPFFNIYANNANTIAPYGEPRMVMGNYHITHSPSTSTTTSQLSFDMRTSYWYANSWGAMGGHLLEKTIGFAGFNIATTTAFTFLGVTTGVSDNNGAKIYLIYSKES